MAKKEKIQTLAEQWEDEKKVREVLAIVKKYNSEEKHYEAPYLDSEDMKIIEEALEKQLLK